MCFYNIRKTPSSGLLREYLIMTKFEVGAVPGAHTRLASGRATAESDRAGAGAREEPSKNTEYQCEHCND